MYKRQVFYICVILLRCRRNAGLQRLNRQFRALTFVLYSKPFRKINKPQLINSVNNADLLVEVEFTVGSKEYKIIRGMKTNLFEIGMIGCIVENGTIISDEISIN